jgi:predicted dehydrogenase
MTTFNWGIIGLGRIAHKFAADLAKTPGAKLTAVASRDLDRSTEFARQYGASHCYGSYEDIIQCPDLDAVYIATPNNLHRENTLFCLAHQIPVLCEKPFSINIHEARQMVQEARTQQTFLMEVFWTRFLPTTFGFKPPFEPEGRLFNPELGGGALLDIGVYPLFLATLVLGMPTEVTAKAYIGSTGVDEDTAIILRHQNGALSHLHTTIRMGTKSEAFIYGETGTIHFHSRFHEMTTMSLLREGKRPEFFQFNQEVHGYTFEAQEVMRCVSAGLTESPGLELDYTLARMELLDEIRRQIGLSYPMENVE